MFVTLSSTISYHAATVIITIQKSAAAEFASRNIRWVLAADTHMLMELGTSIVSKRTIVMLIEESFRAKLTSKPVKRAHVADQFVRTAHRLTVDCAPTILEYILESRLAVIAMKVVRWIL